MQNDFLANVPESEWRGELEKTSFNYHMKVLWVATFLNPIFAITDYFTIPNDWQLLLSIRLTVSAVTLIMFVARKKFGFPSRLNIAVTFMMISLQNAFIFHLINSDDLLGQNLNYIALFIGAAIFILREWYYSLIIIAISFVATTYFVLTNSSIDISQLCERWFAFGCSFCFHVVLIRTHF